ncbi:MAG: PilZ domain-containing protein [Polyangiaceae bacterium]
MRSILRVTAVLTASAAGLLSREAGAYTVRKSADGTPVRWAEPEIEVSVDPSVIAAHPGAPAAVAAAFRAWGVVADTEIPSLVTRPAQADDVGFRAGADGNHSTVRFAAEGSPLAGGALAVTVLTFDDNGRIVDADVIINGGVSRAFDVVDDGYAGAQPAGKGGGTSAYDLQNVLTHEVGHFLGLGEEEHDTQATMFLTSARGETQKRDLAGDDETGLRELYVPGSLDAAAQSGGCAVGTAKRGRTAPGSLYLLGVALAAAAFARRRRAPGGTAALAMLGLLGAWGATGCAGSIGDGQIDEGADAMATVLSAVSRWDGGLLVTSLELRTVDCAGEDCPAMTRMEVFGGSAGGYTQVVGHRAVPAIGDIIPLVIRDGRARWHDGTSRQSRDPMPRGPGAEGNRDTPAVIPTKAKPDPRRTHERAEARVNVTLHGSDGELHGITENISEGGLFVALDAGSRAGAARGEPVAVTLELPGRAEPVHAVGEVRWVRGEGGNDEPAGIGIRFTELDGDDAEAIRALVSDHEIL